MVAIISSPTVYICIIICRHESALIAATQKQGPAKMFDAMIENYPEEINARDESGMYFQITHSWI